METDISNYVDKEIDFVGFKLVDTLIWYYVFGQHVFFDACFIKDDRQEVSRKFYFSCVRKSEIFWDNLRAEII